MSLEEDGVLVIQAGRRLTEVVASTPRRRGVVPLQARRDKVTSAGHQARYWLDALYVIVNRHAPKGPC